MAATGSGRTASADAPAIAGRRRAARAAAWVACFAALIALGSRTGNAADLQPRTAAAFDRYVAATIARMDQEVQSASQFLWVDTLPDATRDMHLAALRQGDVVIERLETQQGGRAMTAPGGLVHHWIGTIFLPGVPLQRAADLLQNYDRHAAYYGPYVARSALRSREGDVFRFYLRFHMKRVITVVVDTENVARYSSPALGRIVSRIESTQINEVEHPDTPDERQKPAGHDGGYLWRLNTYWSLLERDGGTYLQCESISLTRSIPTGFGWLIKPFVTSLPRESLEFTLDRTRLALTSR